MKEYARKSKNTSHILESNPKVSKQASINEILQTNKVGTLERCFIQRESSEDEELVQTKTLKPESTATVFQQYKESIQQYALEEDKEVTYCQPVVQCVLMTGVDFRRFTKPKIGRRGILNGLFYNQIDPLLDNYPTADRTNQLRILLELKRIIQDWNINLQERPRSKRHNICNELSISVNAEWDRLFLPTEQTDNQTETDRKIDIKNLFNQSDIVLKYNSLTKNRSLIDMLRIMENNTQQKNRLIRSIDRISNISTEDGIKKVIISAHENVGKNRTLFPYSNISEGTENMRPRIELALETFLNRLELMTNFILEIANTPMANLPTTYGDTYYIDSSGSDPHVNGKHALFLIDKLNLNNRWVYKPRSMEPDNLAVGQGDTGLFQNVNNYLQNSLQDNDLQSLPDGITQQDIGFATMNITPANQTEAFAYKTNRLEQAKAKKYFFNAGMLEVLAQIWGLLDLHQDNLIPFKTPTGIFAPLIIDAECSFVRHQYTGVLEAMKTDGYNSEFLIGNQSSGALFKAQYLEYGQKFDQGFNFMKNLIQNDQNSFIKFINLNTLNRVRIVPYKTDVLGVVLQLYTKRHINVNPHDDNNTSRAEFLQDQLVNGFASRANDGYSNPPMDTREPLITLLLNSNQFYYYGLGEFQLNEGNYQQKITQAFDAGTIPAFELEFFITQDGHTECRVLCDSTDNNAAAIIGTIKPTIQGTDMRNMLINKIQSKIQNVNNIVNSRGIY